MLVVLKFLRLESTVQPSSSTEQMTKSGKVMKHKTTRLCRKAIGKAISCVSGMLRLILGNTRGKNFRGTSLVSRT